MAVDFLSQAEADAIIRSASPSRISLRDAIAMAEDLRDNADHDEAFAKGRASAARDMVAILRRVSADA